MSSIINIAAYKFATLTQLKPLRERLKGLCLAWELKGTILLSTEGINLFVAGESSRIELLLSELRGIRELADLEVKLSESDHQPYNRMLVKIKKEIIAFGVPGIDPVHRPAPKLKAHQLKAWLDEGRPVTLLDTRNDYEVRLGTFRNALTLDLQHFRDFPSAVEQLPAELKQAPIVMFCTGGIRCEKAGPFMSQAGFENIFQLEGGILKYFEDCGGAHYDGECFVFDQRVGVDHGLRETKSDQCYACLTPLTIEEQQDPRFRKGISCPYCFAPSDEQRAAALSARCQALHEATHPLPGSRPYDNFRPVDVSSEYDGHSLRAFLVKILPHVTQEYWEATERAGQLLDMTRKPVSLDRIVKAGERYLHHQPGTCEPDVNVAIDILYEDEALVVLNKPAPLPLHPSGQYNRNTLQYFLQCVYRPQKPRPAHRLDANTSGVVLFARTRHFAGLIQSQFERGEVEKIYRARIQGHPPQDEFACDAPIGSDVGRYGARQIDEANGQPARTEFRVLRRFDDGTTLLEVRPLTGRTNQIRLHLWQLGWPICGEALYLSGQQLGNTQTTSVNDPPLCLFAQSLTFTHPLIRQRVTFTAPLPSWADTTGE